MRVHVVDPPAYTPPYDHALCAALGRGGLDVDLFTSHFPYAGVPPADHYTRREFFYPLARGAPDSQTRRAIKLAENVPDMLRYRSAAAAADLVHFQWLALPRIDGPLLPRRRPLVITAHDLLGLDASAARRRVQARLLRRFDALIVHSAAGRERLVDLLEIDAARVHVIPHGAFSHLAELAPAALPPELAGAPPERLVVLNFGLIRPYKGLDVLLDAWRGIDDAELWVVGRPRFDISALRAAAPPNVRFATRFVSDGELAACFRAASLVVLPYREIEQSGVLAAALAFGSPLLASDVGGFAEVAAAGAARLVPPGNAPALRAAIEQLVSSPGDREELASRARALAAGAWSWDRVAAQTRALYETLIS